MSTKYYGNQAIARLLERFASPNAAAQASQEIDAAAGLPDRALRGRMIRRSLRKQGLLRSENDFGEVRQLFNRLDLPEPLDLDDVGDLPVLAQASAGMAPGRWSSPVDRDDPADIDDLELYGLVETTTAAGSTGAGVNFNVELKNDYENVYLFATTANGLVRSITSLIVDQKPMVLGEASFLPATVFDLELEQNPHAEGIYLGDRLAKSTTISGTVFISTSPVDVYWSLAIKAKQIDNASTARLAMQKLRRPRRR